MNLGSLPPSDVGTLPAGSIAARDEWVEARLMRNFMRNGRSALHAASTVIPIFVAILYGDVDHLALLCWALSAVIMTAARYRVINLYFREYAGAGGAQLQAFLSRYNWTWTVSAVVWGSSMFVYFRKAPVDDQFLCVIALAGMAGFAVGAFTACLRCFYDYINGLALSMLAAVVYSVMMDTPVVEGTTVSLLGLVLIYWVAIRTAGERFHKVQRSNLELQFSNATLIDSLTEKTRAAVLAVATKNRLIASAAHDLRQPVHALGLYADWLQSEPELVMQITPKIVQSTRAVNELFNSLFDLAKLDSSTIELDWEQVDLAALLTELELEYAPLAREKGLALRKRLSPAHVRSDRVLLKRLLGNLLSNAIRHTREGGVLLAVRRGADGPCVEVWDTGVGIAPEEHEAIFQEFYRVARHNGTEEGFGLGLAIVSRLCEALGHRVSIRSRVEKGTVFRLDFPANAQATGQEA